MNREISFSFCLTILKKAWIVMLVAIIIAATITGIFTEFFMQKKYSSSVTFYVINSTGADYTSSSVVSALETLTANYMELIKTDKIVEPIAKKLESEYGIKYTSDDIKRMISTTTIEETAMITLKVTHTDPKIAYNIATLFSEYAPEYVTEIEKSELMSDETTAATITECIKTVNYPRLDTSADSPSITKNLAVAILLAAIVVYATYFIIALFDNTIKSEEELKAIFGDYPLMAVIPSWKNN